MRKYKMKGNSQNRDCSRNILIPVSLLRIVRFTKAEKWLDSAKWSGKQRSGNFDTGSNCCPSRRRLVTYRCPLFWPWALISVLLLQTCDAISDTGPEPKFSTAMKNLTVIAGREAKLSCHVENLGDYKIAWTHYGQSGGGAVLAVDLGVITRNTRISVIRERSGISLIISNVTVQDQGRYSCQVSTSPPKKLFGYLLVNVPPRITSPPKDVIVSQGEDVMLECAAKGDPEPHLTWRREDGAAFSLNYSKVTEAPGTKLTLTALSNKDGGAFLCVASNGVPPAVSARVQVFVKYAPIMESGRTDVVYSRIGEKSLLICRYKAWPKPVIVWLKDEVVIMDNVLDDFGVQGSGTSTLVLDEVEPQDFGYYRCTVRNNLGQNSTKIILVEKKTTTTTTTTSTTMSTTSTTTTTSLMNNKYYYELHLEKNIEKKKIWMSPTSSSSTQDGNVPPSVPLNESTPYRYTQDLTHSNDPNPRPLYPELAQANSKAAVTRCLQLIWLYVILGSSMHFFVCVLILQF